MKTMQSRDEVNSPAVSLKINDKGDGGFVFVHSTPRIPRLRILLRFESYRTGCKSISSIKHDPPAIFNHGIVAVRG